MPRPLRVTLRDVARGAGVSTGTASAVFSRNAPVSDEARAAVLRAASELGYTPRRRTTAGRGGTPSVGLLVRTMTQALPVNPFYAHVLHGVQQACTRHGLRLGYETLPDGDGSADRTPGTPLLLRQEPLDGLLLLGHVERRFVADVAASGIPTVLVDNSPGTLPVDAVRNADEPGGHLATRHLLDLGHTDPPPAFVRGPAGVASVADRFAGYHRALSERGLRTLGGYTPLGDQNPSGGARATAGLLALPRPPTAIVCSNDATALGVLEQLREHGLRVPRDVSVVGFDDIDTAAWCAPPLTTIAVDKELMGVQAVQHLRERMEHPHLTSRSTHLAVSLVTRGSTAPRPPTTGGSP